MTDVVLLGEGFGLEDDEGEASQVSLLELAQPPLAERVQLLRHLCVVLAVLHLGGGWMISILYFVFCCSLP